MTKTTLPTIAAGAHATKSIATFARLLRLAGLEEMLQAEGPYTLFAPVDRAFDELPPGVLATLKNDDAQLRAMLQYHILPGRCDIFRTRNGKLQTLEGTLLTAFVTDEGLRIDHADVFKHPVPCANGVIYEISAVLLPGFTPPVLAEAQRQSQASPWSGQRRASRVAPTPPLTAAEAAEALFQPTPALPPVPSTS